MNQTICRPAAPAQCALSDLPSDACGTVRELHGDAHFVTVLASRGLTVGSEVTVLRNSGHGLLLIRVRDTQLAVAREEAAEIEVELITTGDDYEPAR